MSSPADPALDRSAARARMLRQIDDVGAAILQARVFVEHYGGTLVKLVVLPDYLLTSYPGRIGIAEFADKAAIAPDGAEYAAIGAVAARLGGVYRRQRL